MAKRVLLIVSAYNEEESIVPVVTELIQKYAQFDYVIGNDGSSDSTARICEEQGFHLINQPINLGPCRCVPDRHEVRAGKRL